MDPNVYGVGKLYVPKPTNGTGDLTFTRSNDTATRVGPDGLIEKVRTNVLLQSNTFTTSWGLSGTTLTSGQTGYDGLSDAWLLSKSAAVNRYIFQYLSFSGLKTFSVFAKANTLNNVRLYSTTGTSSTADFSLVDGSLLASVNILGSSSEDLGNGWWRFSITTDGTSSLFRIYPDPNGTTAGSIYFQNAQLETGDIATDYIATTTTAVSVGPVANLPRLDYTDSTCPKLLLEPQRTNAFLYSNQPEGTGWDRINCTFQTGFAGPDGYNSARKVTATSNDSVLYYQNTSVTSGTSYTASVYVKSAGKSYFQITGSGGFAGNEYVNFDLQTGTIVYESGSALTGKIEALTDGWYRVSVTQIATSTTSGRFLFALIDTATAGRVGVVTADGNGVLVWEHQMEASSYPTSIIPTLGSAVTRGADSCSKTGISSLIGQTEGVVYFEWDYQNVGSSGGNIPISLAGASGKELYFWVKTDGTYVYDVYDSTKQAGMTGSMGSFGIKKIALAYKNNDFALYINGVLAGSDTSGSVPALTDVYIGRYAINTNYNIASGINQALLFTTRLTNAQLAELTA